MLGKWRRGAMVLNREPQFLGGTGLMLTYGFDVNGVEGIKML